MDAQELQQSFLLEAGGLERVIQLTKRPDFPRQAKAQDLAQYVDSLKQKDQPFYDALYDALRGYEQGIKAQEKLTHQTYFGNSKTLEKIAYNTIFLPLRPVIGLANFLSRTTKTNTVGMLGLAAGLAAEIWLGGTIREYVNEPLGRALQGWPFLSFGTAFLLSHHYRWQRQSISAYEKARGISVYYHDLARKLVEHFDQYTGAVVTKE